MDTKTFNAIMAQQSTLDQLSQFRSLMAKSPRACVVPFVPRVAARLGDERVEATWREVLWRSQGHPPIIHGYGVPTCGDPRCIAPHHQRVRYSEFLSTPAQHPEIPASEPTPPVLAAPRREFPPTIAARLRRALTPARFRGAK